MISRRGEVMNMKPFRRYAYRRIQGRLVMVGRCSRRMGAMKSRAPRTIQKIPTI
jgi:hypothetical protein